MQIISTAAQAAAALAFAERRALHSSFDQHVLEDGEGTTSPSTRGTMARCFWRSSPTRCRATP
jgi:hypothetical protein